MITDKLKPEIVPAGIKTYIEKVCTTFHLEPIIYQTAMKHVNKYGSNVGYSDKDPKCVAAGLISVIIEEGMRHGWYKGRPLTNGDLAGCLGISTWSVSNHRKRQKLLLAAKGHKHETKIRRRHF